MVSEVAIALPMRIHVKPQSILSMAKLHGYLVNIRVFLGNYIPEEPLILAVTVSWTI